MQFLPGYRLTIAPRFPLSTSWTDRVLISPGTERAGGGFFPREPWRSASEEELRILVDDSPEDASEHLSDYFAIYQLPQHLLSLWWEFLSASRESSNGIEGFDEFSCEVCNFLDFKNISVPREATLDLLANQPGERTIGWDFATNGRTGLAFNLSPQTPWPTDQEKKKSRLSGLINLGLEPVVLTFLNLSPRTMAQELAGDRDAISTPTTVEELGQRFLQTFPDHPVIGLKMVPGEGCSLPADGMLVDGWLGGSTDPALFLLIRETVAS